MPHKPISRYLSALLFTGALILSAGYRYQTDKVIQINVNSLLNTRSVTTLTNGKLVPFKKGLDHENGYLTMAAALFNGETSPKAIADDPLIPANAHHPAILLHYSNSDGQKNQTRLLADTGGSFTLKVPKNNYTGLYICLTSAYGASKLQYDLVYTDGTETKTITLPDWAYDIPNNDPNFSYVVHDLAKWTNTGKQTETEHHNIHALNIHPDSKRVLTAVKVTDLSKTYVLFWAATGVTI